MRQGRVFGQGDQDIQANPRKDQTQRKVLHRDEVARFSRMDPQQLPFGAVGLWRRELHLGPTRKSAVCCQTQ